MKCYVKIKSSSWVGVLAIIFLLNHANLVEAARGEVRCASLDIRNSPQGTSSFGSSARSELECTIVEGDITLSMMTDEGNTDDMFPVFHNLREITGAILIFQVRGLSSLGRIFPNLRVIGGDSLIMNYALVIYQNQDLRNVGLRKLTVIKNGGVRITENSHLCYTRNINWDNMIVGNLRDVILDTESQCTDKCVVEDEAHCHRSSANTIACWNATECQTFCPYHKFENGTFGPGCTDSGEICHDFCLGGCTMPNDPGACHTCRNVEINGICAASCPEGLFEHQGRRCLTKEGCLALRPMSGSISTRDDSEWKAFNGRCHYECPSGFEEDPNNNRSCVKCVGHCPKKCRGDETIDSVGAALKFRDCNIIDGYLEIEIRIGNGANAEKFSEAFGELEEVTGYLNIRFCSVFTSLHMFKKLRVIHGQQLYRSTYALVVFDNVNLRELFNLKRQPLRIGNGKVQFQNNRLLCYQKIVDFVNHIGMLDQITENDVGPYSNGEKAVCDEEPLEVEVTGVFSQGFSIRWTPFNTTDMDYRKFVGYQIFFKKVDKIDEEMSIDEDRSACGDSWKMQFSDALSSDDPDMPDGEKTKIASNGGELISVGVEANTLYAFYVQTRIVNHPGARNAISKVHFVKTTFGNPDPPRIRLYQARGPDRLEIQWDPPLRPEGVITHYTIQWSLPPAAEHQEKINACSDEVQKRPSETVSKKSSSVKQGTCSMQEGCCDCSLLAKATSSQEEGRNSRPNDYFTEEMEVTREERDAFENAIQNTVFVQRDDKEPVGVYNQGGQRPKRQAPQVYAPIDSAVANDIINFTHTFYNISYLNVSDPSFPEEFRTTGKINISGNSFLLAGLPHFTEYTISIFACQDVNGPDNQCSGRPAWVTIRTAAIPENDLVHAETVHVLNATDGKKNDRRLNWYPPANPNGPILAYRAKLFRDDVDTTPLFKCVNITEFNDEEGITFLGLADGSYSLEIRTVTLAGIGMPLLINDVFQLNNAFMTTRTMIMLGSGLLLLIAILGVLGYYGMHYFLGHKFEEYYWRQTISANPEYLSQIDVYKKDEWELQRDDVQLLDEIGRGTFGQVYRGRGRSVKSACGVIFGECAVKTMPETSTNRERLHFLIEASVMKQFNTAYIVKLFGVVSDQPVLVVMEMMAKGNLRDFLRAHRPDAEENVNRYPLPDPNRYYTWAAQIADGMSYLESIKFCHRDLAARNCMVHADETVKIGDFGMARDIYYHEYYQPTGKRLMPVRWMSPESLKDGKFTVKSDIWSYGIVLYEMLTLGQQPYAGLGNDQVFNYIGVQRRVMVRPLDCPDHWYNLMRACWRYDPRERPNFYQIVDYLAPNSTPEFRRDSFVLNLTGVERKDEPYNFDNEWPDDNTTSDGIPFDGEEEDEEEEDIENTSDEPDKVPLDELSLESHLSANDSDSCSCSSYSETATSAEHGVHPPRTVGNTHRQILDFLNSARHNSNDIEREKNYDRELLLPSSNSNREDEYVMQDPQPQQNIRQHRPQAPHKQASIGDAEDLLQKMRASDSDHHLRGVFNQESEHQQSPHSFNNPTSSSTYSAHNPADWP